MSASGGTMFTPTNVSKHRLDKNEEAHADVLMDVLDSFRRLRATMPLQYVVTLLAVARDEGKSVGEYARKLGISPSVMSRHLLDIGERNRHMEDGFGLVTFRPNPRNLREHEYYLTPKGYQLVQQIVRKMERKPGMSSR